MDEHLNEDTAAQLNAAIGAAVAAAKANGVPADSTFIAGYLQAYAIKSAAIYLSLSIDEAAGLLPPEDDLQHAEAAGTG